MGVSRRDVAAVARGSTARRRRRIVGARRTSPCRSCRPRIWTRRSRSPYVYTDDADALHAAWEAVGVPTGPATGSRLQPPVDTEYGMREFTPVDPSGNLIRVGSPPFAT
jgi:hypothetical protein